MALFNIFALQLNLFSLSFILCSVINVILIIFILSKKINSASAFWFLLFSITTGVMGIAQSFLCMSNNEPTFKFWLTIYNLTIVPSPFLILAFSLSFIKKDTYLKKIRVALPILCIEYILTILLIKTNNVNSYSFYQSIMTPWGRMPSTGTANLFVALIFTIVITISLILLIHFYFVTKEFKKREQAKYIILGFIILGVGAPIVQGFLPSILNIPQFPIAVFLQAILAILAVYSLAKYGEAVFNIDTISQKLLELVPSAVILIDNKKNIESLNPATEKLLAYTTSELVGQPVQKIFVNESEYKKFEATVLSPLERNKTQIHDIQLQAANGNTISSDIQGAKIKNPEGGSQKKILIITSIQAIKDQSKQLEEKFKEAEKQKTELEQANKVMVDRELEMIKIKNENQSLSSEFTK